MEKHAFLKYLKELKNKKHLEEDVVISTNTVTSNSTDGIASNASSCSDIGELASPKAVVGLTDNSVLGNISKKQNNGFLGKNDFFIPKNILSGEIKKHVDAV